MQATKTNLYLVFILVFINVAFGALNSVLSSAYLPDIIKDINNAGVENIAGWINAAFLAGGTLGGIAFGFAGDSVGRKKTLLAAILFYSIGSALGAITDNWLMLVITRFIVGIGVGTSLVLSAVIISEIWPPRRKAIALGILSVAYPVGIILSGIITSNISNWRTAFYIGAASILLVAPTWYFVQETFKRSASSLSQTAPSFNGQRSRLALGIIVYGTMLIGLWSAFSWLPTWVESLLADNTVSGQSERGMAVTFLGVGGLAGGIASGWIGNRLGQKTTQAVCFIVCFLLSFWMFRLMDSLSTKVLIGSALLGLSFGISQGVLNVFIPELFPVQIRSSATGLCFHVGRAFTAVAVFFVGAWAIWLHSYGNAIFTFSWLYIIGLIALLLIKKEPNFK